MDQDKKGRQLTDDERKEMRYGQELYETTRTMGWKHIEAMLEQRAHHTWADPRETNSEKEWMWRELNLFHSADVAIKLIEEIQRAVARADYLGDIESGKVVEAQKMKI